MLLWLKYWHFSQILTGKFVLLVTFVLSVKLGVLTEYKRHKRLMPTPRKSHSPLFLQRSFHFVLCSPATYKESTFSVQPPPLSLPLSQYIYISLSLPISFSLAPFVSPSIFFAQGKRLFAQLGRLLSLWEMALWLMSEAVETCFGELRFKAGFGQVQI